jgi:hypothetical protein
MAAVLVSGVSATRAHPLPQSPSDNCRYFGETGHWVCDDFLRFFETRGELEIFGYPLSRAFDDPVRGVKVQYFQRARLELHPYNSEPYKVLQGLLVDELGYQFPRARPEQIPPYNSNLHHYFPETGHVVSYAFLDYFREMGGLDVFGYPRSEFMYEGGRIVQYFQRARVEWRPDALGGAQMYLTPLVENHIERFEIPEEYLQPESLDPSGRINPDILPSGPTRLNTTASVRHVITGRNGGQTVFIYVTDQWDQPVLGAAARIVVHYQSSDAHYECAPTNDSGFTWCSFDILSSSPGRKVVVDVTVTHGDLTGTTQTFFLPWW